MRDPGQGAPASGNVRRVRAGPGEREPHRPRYGKAPRWAGGGSNPRGRIGRGRPWRRTLRGAVAMTTPGAWGVERTGERPAALGRWHQARSRSSRGRAARRVVVKPRGLRIQSHALRSQSPERGRLSGDGKDQFQMKQLAPPAAEAPPRAEHFGGRPPQGSPRCRASPRTRGTLPLVAARRLPRADAHRLGAGGCLRAVPHPDRELGPRSPSRTLRVSLSRADKAPTPGRRRPLELARLPCSHIVPWSSGGRKQ